MAGRNRNEKYFPVVFLVLFPLAGATSTIEFEMFGGNIASGIAVGGVLGVLCYLAWKKIS